MSDFHGALLYSIVVVPVRPALPLGAAVMSAVRVRVQPFIKHTCGIPVFVWDYLARAEGPLSVGS